MCCGVRSKVSLSAIKLFILVEVYTILFFPIIPNIVSTLCGFNRDLLLNYFCETCFSAIVCNFAYYIVSNLMPMPCIFRYIILLVRRRLLVILMIAISILYKASYIYGFSITNIILQY